MFHEYPSNMKLQTVTLTVSPGFLSVASAVLSYDLFQHRCTFPADSPEDSPLFLSLFFLHLSLNHTPANSDYA